MLSRDETEICWSLQWLCQRLLRLSSIVWALHWCCDDATVVPDKSQTSSLSILDCPVTLHGYKNTERLCIFFLLEGSISATELEVFLCIFLNVICIWVFWCPGFKRSLRMSLCCIQPGQSTVLHCGLLGLHVSLPNPDQSIQTSSLP